MRTGLRGVIGIGLLGLAPWAGEARAQFASPQQAVEALYRLYARNGPGFSSKPAEVRRFLEPGLAGAWLRDARSEDRKLDYDPFVQGQDYEISGLSVRQESVQGDGATVRAQFRNTGRPTTVVYRLVRGPDGWRIRDAVHEGRSLRRILKLD